MTVWKAWWPVLRGTGVGCVAQPVQPVIWQELLGRLPLEFALWAGSRLGRFPLPGRELWRQQGERQAQEEALWVGPGLVVEARLVEEGPVEEGRQ